MMQITDERVPERYSLKDLRMGAVFAKKGRWYMKVFDVSKGVYKMVDLSLGSVIDIENDNITVDSPDNVELRILRSE